MASSNISPVGRMVLPTLSYIRFVTAIPNVLVGLLLIDIAETFNSSVGAVGQIRTVSSSFAFISALLVGGLSVKYNPKYLLVAGTSIILISALTCSLVPNFTMLLLLFPLTGIGLSLTDPMSSTLTAEYFSEDRRASALGWLIAGGSLSWVVGAQVITYLSGIGGWRYAFYFFTIPLLVVGSIASYLFLPKPILEDNVNTPGFMDGMRAVLSSWSSISCLLCSILRLASFQLIIVYSASFLRQEYMLSREITSILVTFAALSYTFGSLLSGRFVTRLGVKNVAVGFLFLGGAFLSIFTLSPVLWVTLLVYFLGPFCFGVCFPAGLSIFLDQVPDYRGTMMSFTTAFSNIGAALGSGIGGLVLLYWGYVGLGLVLGFFGVLASLIIFFFIKIV